MANEVTVPMLPCRSIDEVGEFYQMLGFEQTFRQVRPNPYLTLRREDINLHFFEMAAFNPEDSYGTCGVIVSDVQALYGSFAEGMRAKYGKLLISGIPRMTRPRKRKNADNVTGFTIVDPGGNWIRIFPSSQSNDDEAAVGKLGTALLNVIVIADSKGDNKQAAKILDSVLAREKDSASTVELVDALVYRAELAIRLDDHQRAATVLDQVRDIAIDDADRSRLADALSNAEELARILNSTN